MAARALDDSEHEIHSVLDQLLGTLLWLAATLGSLALIGSLVEWSEQGWHPRRAVDMAVYVTIVVALAARRHVSRVVRSAVVVGFVAIHGVSELYWDGPRSNGTLVLAVACILACTFIGRRAAMLGVVGALGVIVLAGVGYTTGSLPLPDLMDRSPTAWFGLASSFAVFTFGALLSVDGIQQALRGLVARLHESTALLRESEKHYRLLAENTRDVVFSLDLDLNITYVSPSAQRLLGYDADELSRITIRDVLAPQSYAQAKERHAEDVERIARGNADLPLMESEYIRKDGSRFWGELRMNAVHDERGAQSHFQGILRDITERKQAEAERERLRERLLETERLNALGQLAGGVAHDFNNQLGGIIGFAELIAVARNPSDVREYAENVAKSARRAADLTSQLLAFARRGRAREEPVDVHGLIREVTSVLERSIDKNIRVRCELLAPSAVVSGDSSLVQNALLNVALNARDAMPAGGELVFATSVESGVHPGGAAEDHEMLVVRVSDTGTGIDPETKKHIFEPFYTTKEPGRGTGMGLAAVYGTVQSHGGTVEVESAPGQGATFTIRLPLAAPRVISDSPGEALVQGSGCILVIDDEPTVRQMTSSALELIGYRVTSCGSAEEAIALFGQSWRNIDLVVLDMILPDVSGPELFVELRRIDANAKVLFVSGYSAHGNAASLIAQGAAGFLQKPFRLVELSKLVARILGEEKGGERLCLR